MMRLVSWLLLTATIGCFLQAVGQPDLTPETKQRRVEDTRTKKEVAVRILAGQIRQKYKKRYQILKNCRCSVHACGFVFGEEAVCTEFPLEKGDLGCRPECAVEQVNFVKSFVRTTPGLDVKNIADNKRLAVDLCLTQRLDDELTFHRATYPDACNNTGFWTYFSAPSGAFRIWPGVPASSGGGKCPEFDPRSRHWYRSASSGPKNVVVVLEASDPILWSVLVENTKLLLKTFTYLDLLNIVVFHNDTMSLGNEKLIKLDARAKTSFDQWLDDVKVPEGVVVDYGKAISKAFGIFAKEEERVEKGTPGSIHDCQKVIIFMGHSPDCSELPGVACSTSDAATRNGRGREELLQKIDAMQQPFQNPIAIFTYNVGTDNDPGLMQQIACRNEGVYSQIEGNNVDIVKSMNSFFEFITLAVTNEEPLWTESYRDAFGLGTVTSIAMPVFAVESTSDTGPKCFIGVAAHDVPLDSLDPDVSIQDILASLSAERTCSPQNGRHTSCHLQALRADSHQCQERVEPSECYSFTNIKGNTKVYTIPGSSTGTPAPQLVNFSAAGKHCTDLGGHLAVIHSWEEQQFLSGITPADRSWIGLKRDAASNQWEWLETTEEGDEANDVDLSTVFLNGGRGMDDGTAGDCAVIDPGSTSQNVRIMNCGESFSFICEFKDSGLLPSSCQEQTQIISWKNLTMTHNAEGEELRCDSLDGCGFGEFPKLENVICPMGNVEDKRCCECPTD